MQDEIIDTISEQACFLRTSDMMVDTEGEIWIHDPAHGWIDDDDWGTLEDWVMEVVQDWHHLDPNEQKRGLDWADDYFRDKICLHALQQLSAAWRGGRA